MPELSFLDDKRRATKRLVDVIRQQCLGNTVHALAEQTGVAIDTVKNIAHDLIEELSQTAFLCSVSSQRQTGGRQVPCRQDGL